MPRPAPTLVDVDVVVDVALVVDGDGDGDVVERTRLRPRALLPLLLLALSACNLPSQPRGASVPAPPTSWVTDRAAMLSPNTRESLDHKLEYLERETGHQVIVYIDRSIGGASLEEWAARTFQAWGIGRKGLDDGAVLFVLADDRQARIEVGYGLEDRLTDAVSSRIIAESLVPRMRSGDPDAAVSESVNRLVAAVTGQPAGDQPPRERATAAARRQTAPGPGQLIFLVLVGLALLVLFATHPTLALWLLVNVATGGRAGGGGGGGRGGFGGGGGRSGGGGASGSW